MPDPTTGARAVPIYQTTSYTFRDTAHAAALFGLEELGNIYTRIMNPTQAVFEERMASLEGGVAALAVASGQAAETLALLNLAENGGHIVSSASLYGGTYNLFHYTLPKLGIETTFIADPDDLAAWRAAIRPNTKAFYAETLGNPKGDVLDFEGVSGVAHENGIPLVVDNTLATPYLAQPLQHGADIVVHSATKFIGGHGTSIGGVIVDGGAFDYEGSGRFPAFTEPDPSYHGLDIRTASRSPLPGALRPQGTAAVPARHRGVDRSPQLVPLLAGTGDVEPAHGAACAERRGGGRHGSRPGRRCRGSPTRDWRRARGTSGSSATCPRAAAPSSLSASPGAPRRVASSSRAWSSSATSPTSGDVRSLAIHPASTTHSQLTEAEQTTTGVTPDLVRLSVGLESIEDILADLEAGFRAAKGA